MSFPKLFADIGGTNARFALEIAPGELAAVQVLPCAEYATLAAALQSYLSAAAVQAAGGALVQQAGIAIANPITGDHISMTNHHWSFSIEQTRRLFGFEQLIVVNDFTALAMALPFLGQHQLEQVGGAASVSGHAIGLLGAGTGLGVSGLVPSAEAWIPLHSEGGHTSFSPCNAREIAILEFAWREFSHVSSERLLSGPGLKLIYRALADYLRHPAQDLDAAAIVQRGLERSCPVCIDTLASFCDMLGTMAGNLAVTLGARGGIYIGGGIVPRLGSYLAESGFRRRFEQKGRFENYLSQIPIFVITEAYPAFIGLSALAGSRQQTAV
ncbi:MULTISPECIES: glucokinase [unclassified Undibacterium]|uniref:glucokinase n=1 Tax=unclassified Undibacterium TaxID=2630295 RepID=UPI002AC92754|nr:MULTISPECIES: glucokinase [unclassified Undibacterium]MEB0140878.1 glucokinase [Undibacterium sp. CCC2.1]MEB0173838.1 glucokinase [Undibacterium sp. CCC1.1]MEB0177839.1 glucokinase [Undibacterium sp. CCC3.4]MEB0217044.1 glucokinase [Undibacterium sp. 5I2]WPX44644.1 glucokinase [Undibacterium sp. CCC3.4]